MAINISQGFYFYFNTPAFQRLPHIYPIRAFAIGTINPVVHKSRSQEVQNMVLTNKNLTQHEHHSLQWSLKRLSDSVCWST